MSKRGAFTLIELLVVVAIIALLIAIMLPAIGRARKRANTITCMTNLRGLTQAVRIYIQANNAMFQTGGNGGAFGAWDYQLLGESLTRPQFAAGMSTRDRFRFCPETGTIRSIASATAAAPGNATTAWICVAPSDTSIRSCGSYGLNTWLYSPPSGAVAANYYKVKTMTNESGAPAFVDSACHDFVPTINDAATLTNASPHEGPMASAVLDRHIKAVNVSFFDGHTETTPLGTLWTLRWSPTWTRNNPMTIK